MSEDRSVDRWCSQHGRWETRMLRPGQSEPDPCPPDDPVPLVDGERYAVVADDDCIRAHHVVTPALPGMAICISCGQVAARAVAEGLPPADAIERFRAWAMDQPPLTFPEARDE